MTSASHTPIPGARLHAPMRARSPHEPHRAATPLELLFDLVFVVAIAQAANGLHHAISEAHALQGLVGYLMVFFAIWWAWMNFTWFASAYDCDDVPYRLAVFVQISGALILAGGVPAMFEDRVPNLATIAGYVVMRMAMVAQWLRAAAADPGHRVTAQRYALGITIMQIAWVGMLWIPSLWVPGFLLLAALELVSTDLVGADHANELASAPHLRTVRPPDADRAWRIDSVGDPGGPVRPFVRRGPSRSDTAHHRRAAHRLLDVVGVL